MKKETLCFCNESYIMDGHCVACGKSQKCHHIMGHIEADEHERTTRSRYSSYRRT